MTEIEHEKQQVTIDGLQTERYQGIVKSYTGKAAADHIAYMNNRDPVIHPALKPVKSKGVKANYVLGKYVSGNGRTGA